jgi:prepilin-type N-terminal cleavage/methylation domain-containing protein/prepilin-type processing-associated H-X9-DG protein
MASRTWGLQQDTPDAERSGDGLLPGAAAAGACACPAAAVPAGFRAAARRRPAFTLIELLAVVAIIALLLTLLAPSLERARDLAREAVCRANERGLGTAFQVYASQNHYPVYPRPNAYGEKPGDVGYWYEAILTGDPHKMPIWCPIDPGSEKFEMGNWKQLFVSYGYNGHGLGGIEVDWLGECYKTTLTQGADIADPSGTVLLAESAINPTLSANPDGWAKYRTWPDPWNGNPYPRHEDRCNTLWVDGHVSAVVALDGTFESLYWPPPEAFGDARHWHTEENCWDRR